MYEAPSRITRHGLVSDPTLPDPENLPIPLGWTLLVRPYPVGKSEIRAKSSLILANEDEIIDGMSYVCNIARVVSVGPCCWSQPQHRNVHGQQFPWVKPGDFISYPRHVGAKRSFKGVSFILLMDDEVLEKLPDPLVFDDGNYKIDIPQADLEKYNSIYNPNYPKTTRENDKELAFAG